MVVQVLDPVDIGVVSLCSTKNLMLEGGPLPWIIDTSGYYEEGKNQCWFCLIQNFYSEKNATVF